MLQEQKSKEVCVLVYGCTPSLSVSQITVYPDWRFQWFYSFYCGKFHYNASMYAVIVLLLFVAIFLMLYKAWNRNIIKSFTKQE